jgi:hypothetical protein
MDREQKIREKAYSLWQADGGIDGRHDDHWRQAEQDVAGEGTADATDAAVVPQPSTTAAELISKPSKDASGRARSLQNNDIFFITPAGQSGQPALTFIFILSMRKPLAGADGMDRIDMLRFCGGTS